MSAARRSRFELALPRAGQVRVEQRVGRVVLECRRGLADGVVDDLQVAFEHEHGPRVELITLVAQHALEVGHGGVELRVGEAHRGDRALRRADRLDLREDRLGADVADGPVCGGRATSAPPVTAATSDAATASSAMPTDQRR